VSRSGDRGVRASAEPPERLAVLALPDVLETTNPFDVGSSDDVRPLATIASTSASVSRSRSLSQLGA
jgi:hypothetical protein